MFPSLRHYNLGHHGSRFCFHRRRAAPLNQAWVSKFDISYRIIIKRKMLTIVSYQTTLDIINIISNIEKNITINRYQRRNIDISALVLDTQISFKKRQIWPNLVKMWRQFHGCPTSSAGVERLFYKAGKQHDDQKKSTKEETLERSLKAATNTKIV